VQRDLIPALNGLFNEMQLHESQENAVQKERYIRKKVTSRDKIFI
jgi:hypothetical protein